MSATGQTSLSLAASAYPTPSPNTYSETLSITLSKSSAIQVGDKFVVGTDNVKVHRYQPVSTANYYSEDSTTEVGPPGSTGYNGNVGGYYMLSGTFNAAGIQTQ